MKKFNVTIHFKDEPCFGLTVHAITKDGAIMKTVNMARISGWEQEVKKSVAIEVSEDSQG